MIALGVEDLLYDGVGVLGFVEEEEVRRDVRFGQRPDLEVVVMVETDDAGVGVLQGGATNIRAIAAGHYHTLVLDRDGKVSAVGYNNNGQLGDGSAVNRTALTTPVNSLSSVSLIAGGAAFSLAG